MKMIALFNNKGGVGKTTSVINLAYSLAKLGEVLVIDCDGQGNSSRFFADNQPKNNIVNALTAAPVSVTSAVTHTRYDKIDIVVSDQKMNDAVSDFEKLPLNTQIGNCEKLREEWYYSWYAGKKYDYILVDLPPALNSITKTILSVCDVVFVPIELSAFAIQGVPNVTSVISECGCRFGGCFASKFDRECPADFEMLDMIRKQLGSKMLRTVIPQSRVIKNSLSYRLTAKEYMEWTAAADCYDQLADEIVQICSEFKDMERKQA